MDWRREAAGEAHVERGSGAACGDPRRPTGFVGCRPRCRALGEGSPQAERREGATDGPAVERPHLAKAEGAKEAAQAVGHRARLDLGCSRPVSAESEGQAGAGSICLSEMAVACFSHFIIYDFDGTAPGPGLSWRASVAGVALSCAPQSFHNLSCTFSPAPTAPPSPLGQQSSLFLSTLRLRVATRSPCRCACALGPGLGFGEGRGRGTGRLAVSQGSIL